MHRTIRRHNVTAHAHEHADELQFSGTQLQKFSDQPAGHVVLPRDAIYDSARQTFMKAFQHFPQIIVYCAGFSDVLASIRFAQEVGLDPVCRSGGHDTAGYSVTDEMVVDVSKYQLCEDRPEEGIGAGGGRRQLRTCEPGDGSLWAACAGRRLPDGLRRRLHAGRRLRFTSPLFGMNCDSVMGGADGVGGRSNRDGQRRRARTPFLSGSRQHGQ